MEISVIMLTYNHVKYIRQAIESVIAQKMQVSYEILILDDSSTDGTQKILKEYKEKYPSLITLYLNERNSCHPTKNIYFLLSRARGKYIANLDGDDYWIDEMKCQKQYDLLETYDQYSACCSNMKIVNEKNEIIREIGPYTRQDNSVIFNLDDFKYLNLSGIATGSFFCRNIFKRENDTILYSADKIMGDITMYMLCFIQGDIYCFHEEMAAYRYVRLTGGSNYNSMVKHDRFSKLNRIRYWLRLENYMHQNYSHDFHIIPLKFEIINELSEYAFSDVCKTLKESDYKWRYFPYYIIGRYLRSSYFLLQKENIRKKYKWRKFVKDRKPVIVFGTGRVAEEYIDRYGWKKDIMFLVDNDNSKHNTSFKGYFIRDPKEILHYKNAATVLIANYAAEEEIEKQLEAMNLMSYYSYCSMQSRRWNNRIARKYLNDRI